MKRTSSKPSNANGNNQAKEGVVINIINKLCQVLTQGMVVECIVPNAIVAQKSSLVVGDSVKVTPVSGEQHKLSEVMPRSAILCRGDRRSLGQDIVVAANVDYVLAVVTAEYFAHQASFLEAALIAAKRSGISMGIFVSKADLVGESIQASLREKLALYGETANLAMLGSGLEPSQELISSLSGKRTVVIGDRGSGKSTLIHAVMGRASSDRIPSTHSSNMHFSSEGTYIIDTPGVRDLSLSGVTEDERDYVFSEIVSASKDCKYRSCTHTYEEGCQVIQALREGKLLRERYEAYINIMGTALKPRQREKEASAKVDYRRSACAESFYCKKCGELVTPYDAGTEHRNHCPKCLSSVHVDNRPGDRASHCQGLMEPVSVWVRKDGEWAIIHRCRECGALSSNRIAADDNPILLMSLAVKPLSNPPFPLHNLAAH